MDSVEQIYWRSPAKINRFLHITGRRSDGYHLLESLFQTVGFCDELTIFPVLDGRSVDDISLTIIDETARGFTFPSVDENLIVRAMRVLQPYAKNSSASEVTLYKRIPAGGGLGGGSSNAATMMLVLNQLWECGLSSVDLQVLGATLGSDVPFFMQPHSAWVSGVGEKIQAIEHLPTEPLLLIFPDVSIPTPSIFNSPALQRDCESISPMLTSVLSQSNSAGNVMESVALETFPDLLSAVERVRQTTSRSGLLRMTGSGSSFFYLAPGYENPRASYDDQLKHLNQCQQRLVGEGIASVITDTTPRSSLFSQLEHVFN